MRFRLLPTAEKYCFYNSYNGSAANIGILTVQTLGLSDFIIWTDGTLSATNGHVTSTGAGGESICVEGVDTSHWQVVGPPVGSWTKH